MTRNSFPIYAPLDQLSRKTSQLKWQGVENQNFYLEQCSRENCYMERPWGLTVKTMRPYFNNLEFINEKCDLVGTKILKYNLWESDKFFKKWPIKDKEFEKWNIESISDPPFSLPSDKHRK